jgi:hypothetical protein
MVKEDGVRGSDEARFISGEGPRSIRQETISFDRTEDHGRDDDAETQPE